MIQTTIMIVSILIAMISNGVFERMLWLFSGVLFYKNCIKEWPQWKYNYKQYLSGCFIGYFLVIIMILVIQHSGEEGKTAINFIENNQTSVILVFEGEPSTYDVSLAIKNKRKLNKWPFFLPLELFSDKLGYERENSFSNDFYHLNFQEELKKQFNSQYLIHTAYLYNQPYLNEVVLKAMGEGSGKLIISPVLLTESKSFQLINEIIQEINPNQYRVKAKSTYPLWDSEELAISFSKKITGHVEVSGKNRVGILLVGESSQDADIKQNVKQELLFKEKIKDILIDEGYLEAQIRLTSVNTKKIQDEMEKLFEYGVKEVIIMQISSGTEKISTRRIINKAVAKTEIPQHVNIKFISGWRHNQQLIIELVQRIKLLNMQNWN